MRLTYWILLILVYNKMLRVLALNVLHLGFIRFPLYQTLCTRI